MDRAETPDSRLNMEEQTSPFAPRGPKPRTNGCANHRDTDFGENIETRDPHVIIDEDRDARRSTVDDLDNEATELTDGNSLIDDPIHIYLMQISRIPTLSRIEETEVAKRIEHSRRRFRYSVLGTDYILQAAIGLMEKLCQGSLRLDYTLEVSVTRNCRRRPLIVVPGVGTGGKRGPSRPLPFSPSPPADKTRPAGQRRIPASCRRAQRAAISGLIRFPSIC